MRECQKIRHLLALRPADRSADEQKLVEAHLPACPACTALVREYAEQDRLIRGLPRIRFTPLQRSQLLTQVQDEQQAKSNANPILLLRTAATAIVILIALGVSLHFLVPQQAAPPRVTAPPAQSPQTTTQPSPSLPPTIHSSTPSSPETTALPSLTGTSIPPTATPQPPKPTATPIPPTATFPPPPTSPPPPSPTKEPPTAQPTKRPSQTPTPPPPPTVTPAPPTPTATATPTPTPSPTQPITPTVTVEPTVVTTDTSGTEMPIDAQAGRGENPSAIHVESPVFFPIGTDLEASIDGTTRQSKPRRDTKCYTRLKEVDRDEYILD